MRAGYPTVAWLSGGYDAANREDFDATPDKDMRYGGVAGLSGIIGWTKVQQKEQVAMGGGVFNVLKYVRPARACVVVLLLAALPRSRVLCACHA